MAKKEIKAGEVAKFVRDKVSDEDLFGSHSKIANAISGIITNNQDVRLIGLLGPWGSGKSTVINLVCKRFKEWSSSHQSVYVFTFDAWLHQNDPPRRSFLESLIDFLDNNHLVCKTEWKEELDKLSRRAETHTIKSTPALTSWGAAVAISLLFLPLGYRTFLSQDWYGKAFLTSSITYGHLGWVVLFFPFLLTALNYVRLRETLNPFNKFFRTKYNWVKNKPPFEECSLASLFVNKTTDRVENKIIKSPDPTASEFRDTYNKVLNRIPNANTKLVFVIDNIDRVPENEALTMWSTIRSFFNDRSDELSHLHAAESYIQPWVILPLDPTAVTRLFSKESADDIEAKEMLHAFIDKTFDAVFHLGPPVVSDWQQYLERKFVETFGRDVSANDTYVATRVYELSMKLSPAKDLGITPRKINYYLNRLSALKLQFGDEITFGCLACYAAFSEAISEDISFVTVPQERFNTFMKRIDSNWQIQVAAVHYGVSTEKASQVLISPQLDEAIDSSNKELFMALSSIPGFEAAFEKYVEERAGGNQIPDFAFNCALLLNGFKQESQRMASAWIYLEQSIRGFLPVSSFSNISEGGLAALASHCCIEDIKHLIHIFGTAIEKNPQQWLKMVLLCVSSSEGAEKEKIFQEFFVPGTAYSYIKVIEEACARNLLTAEPTLTRRLKCKAPANEIITQFASHASEGLYSSKILQEFYFLKSLRNDLDWKLFSEHVSAFFESNNERDATINTLEILLSLFYSIENDQLASLATNGFLYDRLHLAIEDENMEVFSIILLALCVTNPDHIIATGQANTADGLQFVQNLSTQTAFDMNEVATVCDEFLAKSGNDALFKEMIDATNVDSNWLVLCGPLLKRRVERHNLGDVDITHVAKNFGLYIKATGAESASSFVSLLMNYEGFSKIFTNHLDENDLFIVTELMDKFKDKATVFREMLFSNLRKKPRGWWINIFKSEAKPLELVMSILETGYSVDLGHEYLEAIESHAKKLFTEAVDYPVNWESWSALLNGLPKSAKLVFLKDLLDKMRNCEKHEYKSLALCLYGKSLIDSGEIFIEPDKNVRLIILPILRSDEKECIDDVYNLVDELAPVIEKATPEAKQEIERILLHASQNGNNDSRDSIKGIAAAFNIPLPEAENNSEELSSKTS